MHHLKELGIKSDARVVCHSSLFSFGRSKSLDLLDAILEIIGVNGTLVVPGYVFNDPEPFNRLTTEPSNVGSLSIDVFKTKESNRSFCPIHNHIGIGPLAKDLHFNDYSTSFGVGSDFDYFIKNDFELLLLGCALSQGGTVLHHLEALANVPYRKWINIPKNIIQDGVNKIVDFKYFARSDDLVEDNFDIIHQEFSTLEKAVDTPYSKSYLFSMRELQDVLLKILDSDPYYLSRKTC